jgi:hypothetical protein
MGIRGYLARKHDHDEIFRSRFHFNPAGRYARDEELSRRVQRLADPIVVDREKRGRSRSPTSGFREGILKWQLKKEIPAIGIGACHAHVLMHSEIRRHRVSCPAGRASNLIWPSVITQNGRYLEPIVSQNTALTLFLGFPMASMVFPLIDAVLVGPERKR